MTQKQLKELLSQLSEELQEEISLAKSDLRNARTSTTKLTSIIDRAKALLSKAENPETGIATLLESASSNESQIAALLSSATTNLGEIETAVTAIEEQNQKLDTSYTEFLATKEKIDDEDTGLEALLVTAKELKAKVQNNATRSASLLSDIETNLSNVKTHITELKTAYTEFLATKEKIDDEDTGLEALLVEATQLKNDISALSKDSQTLYKEISRYKDQAAKNVAGIQSIREESDEALEIIKQNKVESEETKTKISKIFELVSQSGHANYFDERRKKLIFASWAWLGIAIASLVLALYLAGRLLLPLFDGEVEVIDGKSITHQTEDVEVGALILRATIITPIVGLSIFSFRQYGKERRLAEQYAFKAVSASTIEGSIALIERSLKTVPSEHLNTQLADFAIQTAHSLHAEPQELQKVSKYKFNAGNKLINVGAELNETLEDIGKDIKDVIKAGKESK